MHRHTVYQSISFNLFARQLKEMVCDAMRMLFKSITAVQPSHYVQLCNAHGEWFKKAHIFPVSGIHITGKAPKSKLHKFCQSFYARTDSKPFSPLHNGEKKSVWNSNENLAMIKWLKCQIPAIKSVCQIDICSNVYIIYMEVHAFSFPHRVYMIAKPHRIQHLKII